MSATRRIGRRSVVVDTNVLSARLFGGKLAEIYRNVPGLEVWTVPA